MQVSMAQHIYNMNLDACQSGCLHMAQHPNQGPRFGTHDQMLGLLTSHAPTGCAAAVHGTLAHNPPPLLRPPACSTPPCFKEITGTVAENQSLFRASHMALLEDVRLHALEACNKLLDLSNASLT